MDPPPWPSPIGYPQSADRDETLDRRFNTEDMGSFQKFCNQVGEA